MTRERKEKRLGGGAKREKEKGGEGKRDGGKKSGIEKTSRGQRRNKVIGVSKVLCNPLFICQNPNPVYQNVSIFGDRNLKKRLR